MPAPLGGGVGHRMAPLPGCWKRRGFRPFSAAPHRGLRAQPA